METIIEAIMGVMFDAAMVLLIMRLLGAEKEEKKKYRFISAVFAVGFLLGTISKCLSGGSPLTLILFALGFMLSYTAFVFTFPGKRNQNEGR